MLTFIRKNNKVVIKKLQADTLFGILLSAMMVGILAYSFNIEHSTRVLPFAITALIVVAVTLVLDLTGKETKFVLLDNLLYLGLIIYFSGIFRDIYEPFLEGARPYLISLVGETGPEHDWILRQAIYPLRLGDEYRRFSNFVTYFPTWIGIIVSFYSLYGFFNRYDSRIKQNHKRTSIFGLLENVTKASTADVSRSSGLTAAGRTQLIQDTLLGEEFTERLEENQRIEEYAENKRDK